MVIYHYSNLLTNLLIILQQIHPRLLCGRPFISVCIICKNLLPFVGSDVIILRSVVHLPLWYGLDIPYNQIQA